MGGFDYQFIIKGYNSGTTRWKRCVGQGMRKGLRASMPSPGVSLSPNFHVFTNLEGLITCFVDEIIFMYSSQDNYITMFKTISMITHINRFSNVELSL